ncbi:MAG TPA: alpha/beta hydrolase [Thermoanaerobaculia bacterium]
MKRLGRLALLAAAAGCAHRAAAPASPVAAVAGPAGRLAVDDGGSGSRAPVLFVHGNGSNKTQWAAQLAHLRPTRRAAALDLRGMGASAPASDGDYSVEAFAADVAAVADALSLRRFVLVGHSFGGAVVCAYAGRHPGRLAGLVFADVAGDLSATPTEDVETLKRGLAPEKYAAFTDAWFAGILKDAAPATREAVMRSLHATPREVFTGATLGLYAFRLDESLARYPGPRLSIASYLAESPFAIHKTVPGVPVRVISGASHWLMMDKADEFDRDLDDFIAELDRLSPEGGVS